MPRFLTILIHLFVNEVSASHYNQNRAHSIEGTGDEVIHAGFREVLARAEGAGSREITTFSSHPSPLKIF